MYTYTTKGICARQINFDIEEGKLRNVSFMGGCNGNTKAVSKLLEGQNAAWAVGILKGNDCNGRGTSCADQLARAVQAALDGSLREA